MFFEWFFHPKKSALKMVMPPQICQPVVFFWISFYKACFSKVLRTRLWSTPHPGCQSPPGWRHILRLGNPNLNLNLYLPLLLGEGYIQDETFFPFSASSDPGVVSLKLFGPGVSWVSLLGVPKKHQWDASFPWKKQPQKILGIHVTWRKFLSNIFQLLRKWDAKVHPGKKECI